MSKKHKWYNEIVAWASGAEIESRYFLNSSKKWTEWEDEPNPTFCVKDDFDYRIKPQPKEPQYLYVYKWERGGFVMKEFPTCDIDEKYIGKIKLEQGDE